MWKYLLRKTTEFGGWTVSHCHNEKRKEGKSQPGVVLCPVIVFRLEMKQRTPSANLPPSRLANLNCSPTTLFLSPSSLSLLSLSLLPSSSFRIFSSLFLSSSLSISAVRSLAILNLSSPALSFSLFLSSSSASFARRRSTASGFGEVEAAAAAASCSRSSEIRRDCWSCSQPKEVDGSCEEEEEASREVRRKWVSGCSWGGLGLAEVADEGEDGSRWCAAVGVETDRWVG